MSRDREVCSCGIILMRAMPSEEPAVPPGLGDGYDWRVRTTDATVEAADWQSVAKGRE